MRSMVEGARLDSVSVAAPIRRCRATFPRTLRYGRRTRLQSAATYLSPTSSNNPLARAS